MSILNFNPTTFTDNLLGLTNSLITQPQLIPSYEVEINEEYLSGGSKTKPKPKSKSKSKSNPKKEKPKPNPKKDKPKPKKEIDTYLKDKLVKIAKKHKVTLKTREGTIKTKEQLFNSLKRKKLL